MTIVERRRMLPSKIIGRFKMNSAKQINLLRCTPGEAVWQKNYFEHVVRNEKALRRIQDYINNNPERWSGDCENSQKICNDEFEAWLLSFRKNTLFKPNDRSNKFVE
ncbi:MAG: transposase [Ignavibacteriales bacterium]|nr:transposase [Ignavibacteriales bacterium]